MPEKQTGEAAAPSDWVAFNVVRNMWQEVAAGSAAVPATAWRRWSLILTAGFVLSFIFTLGFTHCMRYLVETQGLQAWDEEFAHAFAANSLSFSHASLMSSMASILYAGILILFVCMLMLRRGRPLAAASMVAAYVLCRPLVLYGWWLWDRARPQFVADGVAALPTHSFPSGHAALAVVLWGFVGYLWFSASRSRLEQMLALLMTGGLVLVIAASRIRLGVHWPSDVAGGLLIGLLWLAVVILAHRSAERIVGNPG